MIYADFQQIISTARMARYLAAMGGNTRKTMTLYRYNLIVSQQLFTIISCFEVALRNRINLHFLPLYGFDWLRDEARPLGRLDNRGCRITANSINDSVNDLGRVYTHDKLVAELGFGFWRFLFAPHQFRALGSTLLHIFPAKPVSTPAVQYNQAYVFSRLASINKIRNRIAHHEPVCFQPGTSVKDTTFIRQHYSVILDLFQWMGVNESEMLYGIDHVSGTFTKIDHL